MVLDRLQVSQNIFDKLLNHFGSEEALVSAVEDKDVSAIAGIPGISEKKACEMLLSWHATGVRDLIQTEQALKLFLGIQERILEFANTPQTRNRVKLLRPLADVVEIKKQEEFVLSNKQAVKGLDLDTVARNLKRIKPFAGARPKFDSELLYIAENEEIYARWEALGIPSWAYLSTPDDSPNPTEYSLVVYLYDSGELSFEGLENVVMVHAHADPGEALPVKIIRDFENNYNVLSAVKNLSSLLNRDTLVEQALEILDGQKVAKADPEEFESWVEQKKDELNNEITEAIKSTSFTGDQVVDLLSKDLPEPIMKIYDEAFAAVRQEARLRFGVHILPFKEDFPVEVDQEGVEAVRRRIGTQSRLDEWEHSVHAAMKLQKLQGAIEKEIIELIEFDYRFCLGRFALAYDINPATHNEEQFWFKQGLSLDFYNFENRQFIDYGFGKDEKNKVVILTGANSGGKTSLLETLSQMTIMKSMGLGIRAKGGNIPLYDELFYYQQKRSMDAGGFETFLKGFMPLCMNPENKMRLVLADELESITELEAASKILSTFIEELQSTGSYAVIVTHMANEISGLVDVRIDGIEATGLDEKLELVVDRTPKKDYYARSTPELILRKLRADSKGELKDIYDRVLGKF